MNNGNRIYIIYVKNDFSTHVPSGNDILLIYVYPTHLPIRYISEYILYSAQVYHDTHV